MSPSDEQLPLEQPASFVPADPATPALPPVVAQAPMPDGPAARRETRRWWIKLIVQPLLLVVGLLSLILGLALAQNMGWLTTGDGGSGGVASKDQDVRYICPMMCTPPQLEPGRCPVCAMELVPAAPGTTAGGSRSIQIDPASRRIANIQTVSVRSMPATRTIRAVGELTYNEGALKTIAAYVDGRLERLYADYTGVVVSKGDELALVYSPKLYSSQVEYLLARKALENSRDSTLARVAESNREILASARKRLRELGMTEQQIQELEQTGEANSRLHLSAPISGTVIDKLAEEGQYVKEGQAIYKLADLSSVWLMLKLFPEDAAQVRYGQRVDAEVQSLPGRKFAGRVAFIDPKVDPQTRTVGVRVVIPNKEGANKEPLLRVGDYATAVIEVPLGMRGEEQPETFDPELADKWISPRHPHVVQDKPGDCPICGVDLVPASEFGFTSAPTSTDEALVVPRSAVLMAGNNSVVYVETESGNFEIRPVVLGPTTGDQILILSGLSTNDQVATRGNFLIDSQMQLAGNPSLIDPTKILPGGDELESEVMLAALQHLSPEDRSKALAQRICPVTQKPLGSMGTPVGVDAYDQTFFLCCAACETKFKDDPRGYLANLTEPPIEEPSEEVKATLAKLSEPDRKQATQQRICPVTKMALGSMGVPPKVAVADQQVFICCENCRKKLVDSPQTYMANLKSRPGGGRTESKPPGELDLPPITRPIEIDPASDESSAEEEPAKRKREASSEDETDDNLPGIGRIQELPRESVE